MALNINCTFAILFFKILLFQPILFHIIAVEAIYAEIAFEYSSVIRQCLANQSCMSRSEKGDMLVCMVSTVKLIPCKFSVICVASLDCFTHNLAPLKKLILPGLA